MARINKAIRPFFAASKEPGQAYFEDEIEFDWHSGMSWQVRQRSSDSLREMILAKYSEKGLKSEEILEVSTASHDFEVGRALSAMNLILENPDTLDAYPVENWFQSSKVFSKDGKEYGPYPELLNIRLAKRYINPHPDKKTSEQLKDDQNFIRIQNEIRGASMSCFMFNRQEYPLTPKSAFYDYLYVSALTQPRNADLARSLLSYRVFTDIMFNPSSGKKRRFNTQARSCAIYVSLSKRGLLDEKKMPPFDTFLAMVEYESEGNQGHNEIQETLQL